MNEYLHKEIFLNHFQSLIECFPALKSQAKIKRIHYFMKDTTEDEIIQIVNHVIDNFKITPTPNDFHEATQIIKKRNTYKKEIDETPSKILCESCGDIGIVRIIDPSDSKFDSLINCGCKTYVGKQIDAPIWDISLSGTFKKEQCPLYWFKPKGTNLLSGNETKLLINSWVSRKKQAEKFWKDKGY